MGIERAEVICPFYRYDDGSQRVVCEGLTDTSTLTQRFRGRKQMERFMEQYCFRDCVNCGIFRMLLAEKYAEG